MKKSIKNQDIEEVLIMAMSLDKYPMPGDLTLAVVHARNKVRKGLKAYLEASKQVGESRCEKDKAGKPVTVLMVPENPNSQRKLKFKDEKTESMALEELTKLSEKNFEFETIEYDKKAIQALRNVTAEQMAAIDSLICIADKK